MSEQQTLGNLITALQRAVDEAQRVQSPSFDLVFVDWNLMKPKGWCSYRGYYHHLAIEFGMHRDHEIDDVDILTFLEQAHGMIGAKITGYKGGEYTVSADTPIWVSNSADASGVAVTGFKQAAGMFLIETTIID